MNNPDCSNCKHFSVPSSDEPCKTYFTTTNQHCDHYEPVTKGMDWCIVETDQETNT